MYKMKRLTNWFFIGNDQILKKIVIAVVLILLVVVPAVSVQGVGTMLTVNADTFIGFSGLTSSLNPSVYGDLVTFTAVVSTSGGAPTGKVIFAEIVMEGWTSYQILLGEDTTATSLGGDSYEYTFSTSTLAIGNHAIIAGYDDGSETFPATVGPIAQTVAEQIWPTVTITSAPPEISYSTDATFEFSSDTAGTEFECSLSEGYGSTPETWTWSACSSPQVYTDLSFGVYYGFAVKAQGAPITTSTIAAYQWYISVPQVTITGGPAEYTESTEATLTFSSVPAGVDLVCYLLEQEFETQNTVVLEEWIPCTSPRTYTGLSRGNAYYFGVKPVGAADNYAAMRQWMISRLTLTSSLNPSQFGSDVTFTATLWDDSGTAPGGTMSFAEMVYSWPGIWTPQPLGVGSGPIASGTGSYAYTFLTSALSVGSHDIVAMYTDEVGTITSLTITQEVTEVTAQAPVITTQPANYTTCAGSSVSFASAASGTPVPTVQWQVSNDGGTSWNNLSGATTATYAFTAAAGDNGKRYRAVFTNSAGSATSSAAILTVNTVPAVTTQPTNLTVTYGVPSAIFSAAASGTAPSVQWRRSTNGTTWELISGATSTNLTIANPTVLMSGNQYRAEFSNVCGTAISNAATLTVNKAPVTATTGNYSDVYDGAAHSPSDCTVTGAYTGDLSCTNNPTSVGPDVGSGTISPVVSGTGLTNYEITNVDGYWEIIPAAVTITAGYYSGIYDGAAHSPSECTVTSAYTGNLSCTNNPASVGPDVGSGSVVPELVLNGETETNFTVTSQNGSWEIMPAAVVITAGDYSSMYDGDAHLPSDCSVTGAYTGNLSCTNNPASVGPDVGSGSVTPELVLNGETETNFIVTSQNGSWEITFADPTCSIGGYTGIFDGDPHGASGSCTGVKGETLAGLELGGSFTNVPGGTASWNFVDETGNYNDDSGSVEIIITKAEPACSISGYNSVYDGYPHGASGSCTGVQGEVLTILDLGATFTNVPGGTAYWTFTDDSGNYEDDSGNVEIVINKADPTCTIDGYTGVYDANPHGASGSCIGVKEDVLSTLNLGETLTNVPGGIVNWTFIDTSGNYNDDSGSVKIVIEKAALTVTADNQTAQYSDATPTLTFKYGSFQGNDDVNDIDTPPACSTNREISSAAGDYNITCSGGEDNNYTYIYIDGTFTVTHENAKILLENEVAFLVDAPGEDLNTLVLYADVQEVNLDIGYGPAAGDIDKADVTITLTPIGIGGPLTGTCAVFQDNGKTGYDKINTYECTFTNVEVNTYLVEASVVGDYYVSGPAEDVLVVYDPSLGFTTAGGWFYWPGTTEKTNFGYTMKYTKKGNKVQGSLLLIRHTDEGNYRIKSNALYGLALGEFDEDGEFIGWASFSGKCTYQEPDWLEPEGNHIFMVYVEDRGDPGAGLDNFWIDVDNDDGNLSLGPDAKDYLVLLNGGNIVVPHTPN